jgi:drug/metabolite transporter (DMT)-like permease
MSALALSVLLCLVSALAYAGGAIVQEQVAATTPDRPYAPLRRGGWWAAVALNGLGALLHVVALAYGPLSLVQPLGALTIVFALPMAAVFVRRRAGAAAWRGAVLATVGLAGLLALTGGDGHGEQSLAGDERIMLLSLTGAVTAVLFLAAHRMHRAVLRSVLLAAAAGTAFGMGSVFTKSVAESFAPDALHALWPDLTAIAVLAAAGLLLSQAAYRGAGLTAPLATVTVVNPVVAAAVGLTLFDEGFRYGTAGTTAALASGLLAAAGLILLTAVPAPVRGSDADAVAAEVPERVDVGAVPGARAHLEVQVRSGGVAGGARAADALAAGHLLAGLDAERRQVRVLRVPAVAVPDDHLVAVGAAPAGGDDLAGADGLDGGAGRHREVDARVVAAGPGGSRDAVAGADGGVDGSGETARGGLLLR